MAAPPEAAKPVGDFRTLAVPPPENEKALLEALVRDTRARQSIVRDLLEDDEDVSVLPFVDAFTMGDGITALVEKIRDILGVTHSDQQGADDAETLFKLLRGRAESAGVFVLLIGDLGSAQHNGISVKTFRGYALVDPIAPFIVINDRDAKAARSFTLIHEFAHILLGAEGISGPIEPELVSYLPAVEVFCNQVASEFLLPASALPTIEPQKTNDEEYVNSIIEKVARYWNVSRPAVVYRFYRANAIGQSVWVKLRDRYSFETERKKEREKEKRAGKKGGPDYYVVKRDRLGNALLGLARQMVGAGSLSYTRAAKLLAVKASNVATLLGDGH